MLSIGQLPTSHATYVKGTLRGMSGRSEAGLLHA